MQFGVPVGVAPTQVGAEGLAGDGVPGKCLARPMETNDSPHIQLNSSLASSTPITSASSDSVSRLTNAHT